MKYLHMDKGAEKQALRNNAKSNGDLHYLNSMAIFLS